MHQILTVRTLSSVDNASENPNTAAFKEFVVGTLIIGKEFQYTSEMNHHVLFWLDTFKDLLGRFSSSEGGYVRIQLPDYFQREIFILIYLVAFWSTSFCDIHCTLEARRYTHDGLIWQIEIQGACTTDLP